MLASGGGAPGGGPPAPGIPGAGSPGGLPAGAAPSPEQLALQGATSQLDGANPQGLADMLTQVNDVLAKAYLTFAMRIPDGASDIAKARQSLEAAKKKAVAATQVLQSVRPIVNSAGVGPMPGATAPGAGQPDISALLGMG